MSLALGEDANRFQFVPTASPPRAFGSTLPKEGEAREKKSEESRWVGAWQRCGPHGAREQCNLIDAIATVDVRRTEAIA